MKKLNKPVVIISTLFALGVGGMVFSGVQGIRQIPLVSQLDEQSAAANKKLDAIEFQARKDTLLCVKTSGAIPLFFEKETKTIEEAAKPVQKLSVNAYDARVMTSLYAMLFVLTSMFSISTGVILLARRAFQKKRERESTTKADVPSAELVDTLPKSNSRDFTKGETS